MAVKNEWYVCICGWQGERSAQTLHPRQGFGVCPRCWSNGTERSPTRVFKVLVDHELQRADRHCPRWLRWSLVEKWRAQIEQNHDQALERLMERGGLSPAELWCAAHGKGLQFIGKAGEIDDERALPWLYRVYNKDWP